MNDENPSSLKEIFAFISLSYAMTGTMNSRGKTATFCLDSRERSRWSEPLESSLDHEAFNDLLKLMWPDLFKEDREISCYSSFYRRSFDWYTYNFDWTVSNFGSTQSPLRSTADRLLLESSSDEKFRFSDWLKFSDPDLSTIQLENHDLVGSLGSPSELFSVGTTESRNPYDPGPYQRNTHSPETPPESSDSPAAFSLLQSLAQTVLFMQALQFLIFIGGLGVLLVCLSGANQNCFSTARQTFTAASTAKFSRFLNVAKFRILNPLCLDDSLSNFRPLFQTAIKVLEVGWLRTVRDVERYLISITKLFADSQASYGLVVSKILLCCLSASEDGHIDYDYIYRDDHNEAVDYSHEYITKRQDEDTASFNGEAVASTDYNTETANNDFLTSIEIDDLLSEESLPGFSSKRR
jgi:hypothetical protein